MSIAQGIHGEQRGCYDQGKPETYTEEQLSRVHDILFNAQEAGLKKEQIQALFATLPDTMKLEYNYSNWRYCNHGAKLVYRD